MQSAIEVATLIAPASLLSPASCDMFLLHTYELLRQHRNLFPRFFGDRQRRSSPHTSKTRAAYHQAILHDLIVPISVHNADRTTITRTSWLQTTQLTAACGFLLEVQTTMSSLANQNLVVVVVRRGERHLISVAQSKHGSLSNTKNLSNNQFELPYAD